MRLLLKAKYIILSVLFLVALVVGTKYGWLVQRYTFARTLQNELVPTSRITQDLNRCLRTCDNKDKAFAERFLKLITELENGDKTLAQQLPEMRIILSEAIQRYTEDKAVRSAVETFSAALAMNEELVKDAGFQNEVYIGIEKLVARHPRNGHVYLAQGLALFQKNPRDERAIAAFRKCLLILPTEAQCREGYSKAVESYTSARCQTDGIDPAIQFRLTVNGPEPLDGNTPTVVALSREDVKELAHATNAEDEELLHFQWHKEALARLEAAQNSTTSSAGGLQFSIAKNEQSLAAATLDQYSIRTQWVVKMVPTSEENASLFETLCPQPIQPQLPKRLKL